MFVTEVKADPSSKQEHQQFKVLVTEIPSEKTLDADVYNAVAIEKVNGTCCYVTNYNGQPHLWARLDRKPNKQADKRFKKFLHSKENAKEFHCKTEEDFKPVPVCWIPAKEIEKQNGKPVPDKNGHIPGWVPVEKNSKQYCWHSSVVSYEFGIALVLRHHPEDLGVLKISAVLLSELLEQTLELIRTNINGNLYGLGSKKYPLHFLTPHGAFQVRNLPTLKHNDLLSWLEDCREGQIEGIV